MMRPFQLHGIRCVIGLGVCIACQSSDAGKTGSTVGGAERGTEADEPEGMGPDSRASTEDATDDGGEGAASDAPEEVMGGAGAPSRPIPIETSSDDDVDNPDDSCAEAYDLPHYDGDVEGLCPPAESTQCSCVGMGQDVLPALAPQCAPDGTACILFGSQCTSAECGWQQPPVCPELTAVFDAGVDASHLACISDSDCAEGHYCNQLVANRMFCDDVFVSRAEALCPTAMADGGG